MLVLTAAPEGVVFTDHVSSVPRVIVGRLIPAGTGAYLRGLQRIANKRDEALAAQREQLVEALPEEIAVQAEAEAGVEA